MPRKSQPRVTGVWEKIPGSGVWWIRYRVEGKLKREKVGRKSDAAALYQLRKSDVRAGAKLPESMRNSAVHFKELAEAIRTYSASHHRRPRDIDSRLARVLPDFGERVADKVKPEEIDNWLTAHCKTPATANRYRALFSLVYREALRNGKVTGNPARLVRQRREENGIVRRFSQARVDSDGVVRYVVSAKDPGIPNWLDTAGHNSGAIQGRWTECSATPIPSVRKIAFSDVRKQLPAETPVITAEQRDKQLRKRRSQVQQRPLW